MFKNNKICQLLNIDYPIIQGGMVWCSGWRLACAVSNAGGLGLIGAGSMTPEILDGHLSLIKLNTNKPFGVNLPLIHRNAAGLIEVILKHKVQVVVSSAGNPAQWTQILKANNIVVGHVVANTKFALKAQNAGVDFVVGEGFEAGGHNGREETTSMVLIPLLRKALHIPLVAAGGIYNGQSLLASMALGANAVQIGSRFAICLESSAHENFKNYVLDSKEGSTRLLMKRLIPVRLMLNNFAKKIVDAETSGASIKELSELLGSGRCRNGIFNGDLEGGELEIGQVAAMIDKTQSAEEIIKEIISEYSEARKILAG